MIRDYDSSLAGDCAEFIARCPAADYCHDPAWLDVIAETYGKKSRAWVSLDAQGKVDGFASACYMGAPGMGRSLVCLPYLDYGGPLASAPAVASALRARLREEAGRQGASLEIRCLRPLEGLTGPDNLKVSMLLALGPEAAPPSGPSPVPEKTKPAKKAEPMAPESMGSAAVDAYWKRLDAKVRNQVRKADKSGIKVEWGRVDRLDDFYSVFCMNMRDLGSPVHSKRLFASVLKHFPGAEIGAAYREGKCIGGLFRIHWKDTVVIPWASTLKEERIHSPNNALYWESIRFAIGKGCHAVDFGRSSKEEGTYRFKKQWLADEGPLHWYQFNPKGELIAKVRHVASGKLGWTRGVWARFPLPLANALGPVLRGHISA